MQPEGEGDGCLMEESETHFENRSMLAFRIPIMFKSMGRYSEMGYTIGCKKVPKAKKLPLLSM